MKNPKNSPIELTIYTTSNKIYLKIGDGVDITKYYDGVFYKKPYDESIGISIEKYIKDVVDYSGFDINSIYDFQVVNTFEKDVYYRVYDDSDSLIYSGIINLNGKNLKFTEWQKLKDNKSFGKTYDIKNDFIKNNDKYYYLSTQEDYILNDFLYSNTKRNNLNPKRNKILKGAPFFITIDSSNPFIESNCVFKVIENRVFDNNIIDNELLSIDNCNIDYNDPFITEWDMDTSQFYLPTGSYTGWNWDYYIDWGDGSPEEYITSSSNPTHTYSTAGIYNISVRGSFPHLLIDNDLTQRDKLLRVLNWGRVGFRTMSRMFSGCRNLTYVPNVLSGHNLVKSFDSMFFGCGELNCDLSGWNTHNIEYMGYMFYSCINFNQNLTSWDTSNVESFDSMFKNCHRYNQPLNSWNVSRAKNMRYMFSQCLDFNQPLNNWNVSNVTNMDWMLEGTWSFNQNISGWCVSLIPTEPTDFALNSAIQSGFMPLWGTCQ